MDGSVRISKADRKRYLAVAKGDQRVVRSLIVWLLVEGVTWAVIQRALSTSSATIVRARNWHAAGGASVVLSERRGPRADYGGCAGAFLKGLIATCAPEKAKQTGIVTPGNNVNRSLSGSLEWRTKRAFRTLDKSRNGELFIAHLAELNRALKHSQVVRVICDNARFIPAKRSAPGWPNTRVFGWSSCRSTRRN